MPEVRYCTTEDGVRIAYCAEGEGPPLVVIPTFVESFSLQNLVPEYQDFMRLLGQGRQVVRFDMRGTGLSQRDVSDMSHAGTVRDLEAVVRAAGLKRCALLADGVGGPRAIEYTARHPRLVDRLVLHATFARLLDVFSRETLEGFAHLSRANWELATRTFADTGVRRTLGDVGLRVAEWYRQSTAGDLAARFIEANIELDVTGFLTRVKAPTLVLNALNDPLWASGHRLASEIPNARLVPLEGNVSAYVGADSEPLLGAVNAFLNESEKQAVPTPTETAAPGGFRAVLFTDVVAHTQMMSRLGDQRGRDVLREHERITREVLKQHDGVEVKTMGDGFMASFSSVTNAVEGAVALQRAFDERNASLPAHPDPEQSRSVEGRAGSPRPSHGSRTSPRADRDVGESTEPIVIRIGLNAGEPIEEEGDLFGATVILAARIAAQAEGGEILASLAVRELCAGKGFLFAERGGHALRGFEDPVSIFEVRWWE